LFLNFYLSSTLLLSQAFPCSSRAREEPSVEPAFMRDSSSRRPTDDSYSVTLRRPFFCQLFSFGAVNNLLPYTFPFHLLPKNLPHSRGGTPCWTSCRQGQMLSRAIFTSMFVPFTPYNVLLSLVCLYYSTFFFCQQQHLCLISLQFKPST
uniref:Uncharacterized protein n=1 Tax=Anopheles atroparvus TaxID=41427 RepID=A0A182J132_ANOAO